MTDLAPGRAVPAALLAAALSAAPLAAQLRPETGTLVVVNKQANTASIIDVASGETVSTLPTGRGPHEAAISSDGRWAVVTDYAGGNSLTIIDVSRPAVARTANLSQYPRPHGIAFLPGDSLVAVTSEASQNVVFVRVSDGRITNAIPTGQSGSHMLAAVASGRWIYTSNGAGTVSELDVGAGRRTRILDVAPQLEAITVTRDGREVWVGSNARGTVSVLSTETGEVVETLPGFSWPYRIFITPDNRLAIIPDLRLHTVRFFDRATKRELQVLEMPGAGPEGLTLGGDGRTLYLSLSREDRVAVIDLESMEVVRYLQTGSGPDGIVFSHLILKQ
jgi:DNA-binding beta-propeller fold protein YncE